MSNNHPRSSTLFREREKRALKWWGGDPIEDESSTEALWFDIFLDLALAATYSNLTNNVDVMSETNTLSFVAFFFILWWIWTSQVAYNARFRRDDWIHRLYLFLQLCQFGALATFTSNFDISQKIVDNNAFNERNATLSEANFSQQDVYANYDRRSRLPDLNDRGISLTLGLSRLLLLLQYSIAWYRDNKVRGRMLFSLSPIVISLLISSIMYFATFGIIKDGGHTQAIVKVSLWYSATLIEILALYLDLTFENGVNYPRGNTLLQRCSILMTVIVGEGLNQTTGAFHYIVGNLGFNGSTILNMLSAAIVIFAMFILYFEGWCWFTPSRTPTDAPDDHKSRIRTNFRPLTWVILHILYFSALILFMQSLKSILAFQNLTTAANFLQKDMQEIPNFINDPHVDWDDSSLNRSLTKLGLSWDSWKRDFGNETMSRGDRLIEFYWFSGEIYIYLASLFGSLPSPDSVEFYKIYLFENLELVTKDNFLSILDDIYTPRARSTLWLAGPAGGTLIALAVLNILQRSPPDRYAWLSVIIRLLVGTGVATVTVLNRNSDDYTVFDDNLSLVWRFLKSGWLLPSLALVFLSQVVIDYALIYRAVYRSRRRASSVAKKPTHSRPASEMKLSTYSYGEFSPTTETPPDQYTHNRASTDPRGSTYSPYTDFPMPSTSSPTHLYTRARAPSDPTLSTYSRFTEFPATDYNLPTQQPTLRPLPQPNVPQPNAHLSMPGRPSAAQPDVPQPNVYMSMPGMTSAPQLNVRMSMPGMPSAGPSYSQ